MPTDHLNTASVWELTSTLIQQSINHSWLEAIMVSDPSVSEGGIAFINNISSRHGPHLLSMMKVFMLVSVLSLSPRDRSDLWSLFPPQSDGAIRVEKEQTNAWRALSHWHDEEGRLLRPLSIPQLLEGSKQQHFHMSSPLSRWANHTVWRWTETSQQGDRKGHILQKEQTISQCYFSIIVLLTMFS